MLNSLNLNWILMSMEAGSAKSANKSSSQGFDSLFETQSQQKSSWSAGGLNEQKNHRIDEKVRLTKDLFKLDEEIAKKQNERLELTNKKQNGQEDVELETKILSLEMQRDAVSKLLEDMDKGDASYKEAASLAPLESTPENLAKLDTLNEQKANLLKQRQDLSRKAQESVGNPELMEKLHRQDQELELKDLKVNEEIKAMEAQLSAGKNPEAGKLNIDYKTIGKRNDILAHISATEQKRLAMSNQIQHAVGNPDILEKYLERDMAYEQEIQGLKAELDALDKQIYTKPADNISSNPMQQILEMIMKFVSLFAGGQQK
ncbi:MAG: hypothetical protein A2Y25_02870 [Candidatus Melainabacteria bacterium GWF2_37_15]|nr:MAG: hypothetical protein A2Y25_02870 [Candidatus Melainabacteria bacterium GWF2_37_15]